MMYYCCVHVYILLYSVLYLYFYTANIFFNYVNDICSAIVTCICDRVHFIIVKKVILREHKDIIIL